MVKIDFKVALLGADGTQQLDQGTQKPLFLAEMLSNMLLGSIVKPPMSSKYFAWGIDLVKFGKIEVDETDADSLKNFISELDNVSVLVRESLLNVFPKK